jgi:type I restriction enzyme S subunit
MEVKAGYKQTDFGLIPKDWDLRRCIDLSEKIMVGVVIRPRQYYVETGIPAFRSANIRENKLTKTDLVFFSRRANELMAKSKVKLNDILTVRTGYPGTSAVATEEDAGCNCIDVLITRPLKNVSSRFLSYWINSPFGKEQVLRNQGGLAQQHFNVGDMRELLVALPPLPEQQAIANALSDADALIESLEQLIKKKRQIKQGVMQELLTGKRRLPGFSGEWERKRLGDLGVFFKGSGVNKSQTFSGNIPCVRYGEIYTRHDCVIDKFYSFISQEVAQAAISLKQGDILFAGSGETKEEIGKCVAYLHKVEAYAGGDIVILRPNSADSRFLGYFLNTTEINHQKASRGQGDAVVHISSAALASILIKIPAPQEQVAIAEFLFRIDQELKALEVKLAKSNRIKQAMMQELLTGKVRLV